MKGSILAAVVVGAMVCGTSLMAQAPGDSAHVAQGAPSAVLKSGAAILWDTMGVDFSAYTRRLRADIQRNWDSLIPAEVQPPLNKKGIVGLRFAIVPDGSIGSIKLETPSGDLELDRAAWYAVTSEGKFPPLPKEFHGPLLELRIGFFYSTPITPEK